MQLGGTEREVYQNKRISLLAGFRWISFTGNNRKEYQKGEKEEIFLKAFALLSNTGRACQVWIKFTQIVLSADRAPGNTQRQIVHILATGNKIR